MAVRYIPASPDQFSRGGKLTPGPNAPQARVIGIDTNLGVDINKYKNDFSPYKTAQPNKLQDTIFIVVSHIIHDQPLKRKFQTNPSGNYNLTNLEKTGTYKLVWELDYSNIQLGKPTLMLYGIQKS